jgi:metallo-beta-lactamase class B
MAAAGPAPAAREQSSPDWTQPFPPFKIAGNLYYVGSKGLANYLITTPQGHILINSDLEENVPLIRASVEKLGFKFTDIKSCSSVMRTGTIMRPATRSRS